MQRAFLSFLVAALTFASVRLSIAQNPPSSASRAAATPQASPARSATLRSLIDSMSPADLQKAIELLKSNYVNPEALSDAELDRAKLEGLLTRLGGGAILSPEGAETNAPASPFYSDVLAGHIAYFRIGDLDRSNLSAVDGALQTFASKKIDALVVDLRASSASSDFDVAGEFAKRFCPKGKTLFTLRKASARQERSFTSDREPAFQGLIIALADGDTSGSAEVLAALLRFYNKALVIGAGTAGRPVEYSEIKIGGGKMMRVAVAEAVLPEGRSVFPEGVKPDLPVEMPGTDKREIFQQSREKGMAAFVFDPERPHMNEAALMAGRNPEIEALEAAQRRNRTNDRATLRDPVVQRALDVVTSIAVYQRR